ncbi:CPSF A subunit region-domain-containing protein [Dimargaris cristalligena]|uniref:DNA damage-binding protein 1 n=1 Tax=Dimargaris cristalligena TaxID=215637 RepID=A0A4V1J5D0_9FUNG|nr:CPSF A subunit region-domain-containing protein [Dimargaris cristalligena]|eukprot:RKP38629.1 CPSF A subunit region-domain-containing protein [Dimargaris cristalligena]
MHLYHVTLQPPTHINQVVLGKFSGTKVQEMVLARSSRLELIRPDPDSGKLLTVLTHDVFGTIRSLAAIRLTGSSKDYIIVGSDSGRLVILEYNPGANRFDRVIMETFGKTGIRRTVPGQYLAADPRGRVLMVAAPEKHKFVYMLTRDANSVLAISSPIEAHKAHTLVFDCVALDMGFENPVFACLEVDYGEAEDRPDEPVDKVLTYYELDLGLNHVVRKWSDTVDRDANLLVPLPGRALVDAVPEGPSGVLVCSKNYITYRHQDVPAHRVPIPQRTPTKEDRGVLIVAAAVYKSKGTFFVMLQSEVGDLYKLTVDYEGDQVTDLCIQYFDTVPTAVGLCILDNGCLFVASEFGNHMLYQFEQLGDNDDVPQYHSSKSDESDPLAPTVLEPRELTNLAPIDEMESLAPLLDTTILNLANEDTPQVYALCGRGAQSSFKVLRHGLEINEIAVSALPGHPQAIWSTKLTATDPYDSYIVVSFTDATLVLAIGETVEEVTDSGLLTNKPTLVVQQIGPNALVQVHPQGYRLIQADKRVSEWRPPAHQVVTHAVANERQLVLGLSSGEVVYFELDATGQLAEFDRTTEFGEDITALSLALAPPGQQRTPFLAVGLADSTVRIISLEPHNCLDALAMQALSDVPSSLCLVEMADRETDPHLTTLYLYTGLRNGVLIRTSVDHVSGQLAETRTRFLGSQPVQLCRVVTNGVPAVLALSSRPWLSYVYQSRTRLAPLAYEALVYAGAFRSEPCAEGLVAIADDTLRILNVERLGTPLNQAAVPLQCTPRRTIHHPVHNQFVVYETDHLPDGTPGSATNPAWTSCLRIINPLSGETSWMHQFDPDEAAFGMGLVIFSSEATEPASPLILVGAARGFSQTTQKSLAAFIYAFRFNADGTTLELLHKTEVDEIPRVIIPFQGRALVGMGPLLRIYDLGKRKMLRKCQSRAIPNSIVTLQAVGSRIIIGDLQESIHFALYRPQENRIAVFADDTLPRWITATHLLDYNTVAGGDRFGNLFVLRLPTEISQKIDNDATGNLLYHEKGYLQGAANKLTPLAHFYVGDTITSLQRATLVVGGREVLVYTTLLGAIGALIPLTSKADVDFFQTLETHLRSEAPPLCGRDHITYRSTYVPVKAVIDGDLCEQFALLATSAKDGIAEDLDRTPGEIAKKIEDMRTMYAF